MGLDLIQNVYINPSSYIRWFFETFSVFAFSFFIPCLLGYIISRYVVEKESKRKKNIFKNPNYVKDTKKKLEKSGIVFIIANILWIITLYIENFGVFEDTKLFNFLHYYGVDIVVIFLICIIIMIFISFIFLMINYNRLYPLFGTSVPPNNSLGLYLFKVRVVLIIYFVVLGIISLLVSGYESDILNLLNYI